MYSIRRYGPGMVAPAVSPRPELGRGREQMFQVFQEGFDAVNQFIRPAVVQERTAIGEREALADLGPERPAGGLVGPRRQTGLVAGQEPSEGDQELAAHNGRSFEMRLPFTIRDAAYNATAERVVTARTDSLMTGLMSAATRQATSMDDLNARMNSAREQVIGQIPTQLNGLRTSVQVAWEGSADQARRQRIAAAAAAAAARTRSARDETMTASVAETERLIAIGADGDEIAAHLSTVVDRLAAYGPRGAFTVGGVEFPADSSRAGIMTPAAIGDRMDAMQGTAQRLIVEADFLRTDAPGAYVQQFEGMVFGGESPFPLGESLDLLRTMRGQALTRENQREAQAQEALTVLDQAADQGVSVFMDMTEAGVPMVMPPEQRQELSDALAPYPARRRELETQFGVMDAAAATFGMSGPALRQYADETRAQIVARAEAGEIDFVGVAVIHSLQDRLDEMADSITAESIGLSAIESQTGRGRLVDDVDYDALREQAQGNPDLLTQIAEVQATQEGAEEMMRAGLTADGRDGLIEQLRAQRAALAASATDRGQEASSAMDVLDGLERWSNSLTDMAETDPVTFAATIGVALDSFEGVETMAQVGQIIASRVQALSPRARAEGVQNVVPLSDAEVEAISETFQGSSRSEKVSFLAAVSNLGQDQAMAVYERIGAAEPVLYSAGRIYTVGNRDAARVILRGSVDTRLEGGSTTDLATARVTALSGLLEADMIAPDSIRDLDTTALAYARGLAMAEGGRAIEARDLEAGYRIAVGEQADGTGGIARTRYGTTLLPPGWDGRRINRSIGRLTDEQLTQLAGGLVVDGAGRVFSASDLESTIEELRPSTDDPFILVPLDVDGNFFGTDDGNERGFLTFDLRMMD